MKRINLLFFLLSTTASKVQSNKSDYVGLDKPFSSSVFNKINNFPCVTLYHRNGRIGCGAFDRDDTDPSQIVYWENIVSNTDGSNSVQSQSSNEEKHYVAVMSDLEYTTANMQSLLSLSAKGSAVLDGVIIVNHTVTSMSTDSDGSNSNSDTAYTFSSPASMYPQGYNTPSAPLSQYTSNEYAWNPTGDSNMLQDYYGFPTVFLSDVKVASYIYNWAKEQHLSGGGTKIVGQFNYYMGPEDATSNECLSWRDTDDVWRPKCLPLGGNSVWSSTGTPPPPPSSSSSEDGNDDGNENENNNNLQDWNAREIILLSTSIDSTASFHDASTGASTAASNIMTLLLAAYHVGSNLSWNDLDAMNRQIVFSFFEGESYGYMGSRNFLKDLEFPGLECNYPNGKGCMYPIRPTLNFQQLGNVVGMFAVDQVGLLATEKSFYVHSDQNGGNMENILLQFSADVNDDEVNEYNVFSSDVDDAIPPSPLTSLIELSENSVGGAVLTGYNDAYVNGVYESHFDSPYNVEIDLDAIQNAALVLARSGIAAAYLGEDDDNYQDATTAAINMIPGIDENDEDYLNLVNNLYTCLFLDGICDFWQKYTDTEQKNTKYETGQDLGKHQYRSSGTVGAYGKNTPNYYTSIYNFANGQPVVQVNGNVYVGYNATVDETTKKDDDGTYLMKPSALQAGIYGLLNDFLGRNIASEDEESGEINLKKCSSSSDCSKVSYCPNGVSSVCTGGARCVCGPSAFYHIALDESIEAVPNTTNPGYFQIIEDDEGITPIYTEPFWSGSIGVTMFLETGNKGGDHWFLLVGIVLGCVCHKMSMMLRKNLMKEKLY